MKKWRVAFERQESWAVVVEAETMEKACELIEDDRFNPLDAWRTGDCWNEVEEAEEVTE